MQTTRIYMGHFEPLFFNLQILKRQFLSQANGTNIELPSEEDQFSSLEHFERVTNPSGGFMEDSKNSGQAQNAVNASTRVEPICQYQRPPHHVGTARDPVRSTDGVAQRDLVQVHEEQQLLLALAGRHKAERRKLSSAIFPWVSSLPTSICQYPISYSSVFSDQILNFFSIEQLFILFVH